MEPLAGGSQSKQVLINHHLFSSYIGLNLGSAMTCTFSVVFPYRKAVDDVMTSSCQSGDWDLLWSSGSSRFFYVWRMQNCIWSRFLQLCCSPSQQVLPWRLHFSSLWKSTLRQSPSCLEVSTWDLVFATFCSFPLAWILNGLLLSISLFSLGLCDAMLLER